jgi:hypothetical protein
VGVAWNGGRHVRRSAQCAGLASEELSKFGDRGNRTAVTFDVTPGEWAMNRQGTTGHDDAGP